MTEKLRYAMAVLSAALILGATHVALADSTPADNIEPFGPQTFAELKAQFAGKPFVVSLWSVDCAPCRVELDMLGQMKKADPEFPLLVISTDSIENREDAADILDEYQLADETTWMFADSFVERLRFSIDPAWYGELPRSYFYDAEHNMMSHSGILTLEKFRELFPY
ncbi:MAG: TlpA family protein disulfide reductase [Gammaproteobacteria bacterium]|nr:TlpA family protein disulfide reductase [Gammaproteobacteria bacterium]